MNGFIKQVPHNANPPLRIERDYTMQGHEIILIEGVRYDADLLRAFGDPAPDALYAVRRDGDRVCLTVIHNVDEAKMFFDETIGQGDPAPTEVKNDEL